MFGFQSNYNNLVCDFIFVSLSFARSLFPSYPSNYDRFNTGPNNFRLDEANSMRMLTKKKHVYPTIRTTSIFNVKRKELLLKINTQNGKKPNWKLLLSSVKATRKNIMNQNDSNNNTKCKGKKIANDYGNKHMSEWAEFLYFITMWQKNLTAIAY